MSKLLHLYVILGTIFSLGAAPVPANPPVTAWPQLLRQGKLQGSPESSFACDGEMLVFSVPAGRGGSMTFPVTEPSAGESLTRLELELENRGDTGTGFTIRLRSADGRAVTVHCRIEAGQCKQAVAPMPRDRKTLETRYAAQLRDFPKMAGLPGGLFENWESVDAGDLEAVTLEFPEAAAPLTLRIGQVRFSHPAAPSLYAAAPERFFPFIDRYGQYIHEEWPGKVKSDQELKLAWEAEKNDLATHRRPASFSKFGGWREGPRFKATGSFYPKKYDGKWYLADPEGYLFWSNGINCVRAETYGTLVEGRERFFAGLPEAGTPCSAFFHNTERYGGKHLAYNFAAANLLRKYGPDWRDLHLGLTGKRLASWGFNTVGNWSDYAGKIADFPYVLTLEHACRSSGGWRDDPFDPAHRENIEQALQSGRYDAAIRDPYCIGFFSGNELPWSDPVTYAGNLLREKKSPARSALTDALKRKFGKIEQLNTVLDTAFDSWRELEENPVKALPDLTPIEAECRNFYRTALEHYFRPIRDMIRRYAPGKLYLGVRFMHYPDITLGEVAADFCDVVSMNRYSYDESEMRIPGRDVPILVTEFHFGALDRGMFHPGLRWGGDQQDVAWCYTEYMKALLRNPACVGGHWFQYASQPFTGRCGDGENAQIGAVDITDNPRPEFRAALREVGEHLYRWRAGAQHSGDGGPVIVLPPDAIPAERTAAQELQAFLEQVSGEKPPIAERADAGPAIHIGQSPEAARALGVSDWKQLKPDEIILKTVGNRLYLAGDRPRGSLYAVYELLERAYGVRFWSPAATRVPRASLQQLPRIDLRYAPPFEVRSVGSILTRNDFRYAVRLRHNGQSAFVPPEWGGLVTLLGNVHTFSEYPDNALIPRDSGFREHPEWFAERDGRRVPNGQLCLTNPELRRELVRRVRELLRAAPESRYISVSQNDNDDFCQCRSCAAFVEKHGNQSDLLLDTVNAVAAAVAEEFPATLVETLAYRYTRTPPATVKAAPNVLIRYCTFEADGFRPLTVKQNRQFHRDLAAWSRTAKQLMIWNYIANFRKYYLPTPNWRALGPDLRTFRSFGAISVYEQGAWNGGGSVSDLPELRTWLTARLLWNPDLDTDTLIDEFLTGYYGPGADAVRTYMKLMNGAADRHPEVAGSGFLSTTAAWLEESTLLEAWQTVETAARRFRNDPVYGPRLAMAAVPVGAALLERRKPLEAWKITVPDLRKLSTAGYLAETVARMKAGGGDRLREESFHNTPDEWAADLTAEMQVFNRVLPNDGPAPAVAAGKPGAAWWRVERIADFHEVGRKVFPENDPAASTGRAVRIVNDEPGWNVQIRRFPHGRFRFCAEVRGDLAKNASGDALEIVAFDWNTKEKITRRFPVSKIGQSHYRTVDFGPVTLRDDLGVMLIPAGNPAVRNLRIDRIILVPEH